MSFPVFSVIIPTYNRCREINSAINSVLAQTYQDFELIIVDDGSTDNTRDVVFSIQDQRIRYIFQENGGGSKARNAGIAVARGQYVALLDSDDVYMPHHLEQSLSCLNAYQNVCTYTQVVVNRGNGITFLKPPRAIEKGEHVSDYLMRSRGFVPTISLIVPRPIAQKVKYDEQLSLGDDYDYAIKLVHAGAELIMLPQPGAIWNDTWNENRLSSVKQPLQRIAWLNRIRKLVTYRAYWAEMGWPIAKGFAEQGQVSKALWLFLNAAVRGCFSLKMIVVVFLQISLPKSMYRSLADALARRGVEP